MFKQSDDPNSRNLLFNVRYKGMRRTSTIRAGEQSKRWVTWTLGIKRGQRGQLVGQSIEVRPPCLACGYSLSVSDEQKKRGGGEEGGATPISKIQPNPLAACDHQELSGNYMAH